MNVKGVDVSEYQGDINWGVLSQRAQFVYIRGACGKDEDDKLVRNLLGATEWKVPYGLYFAPRPGSGKTWLEQAKFHGSLVRTYSSTLPVAVDIELDGGLSKFELDNWLSKYIRELCSQIGVERYEKIMTYTSPGFFDKEMPLGDIFWRTMLWVADWTPPVQLPKEWSNHKKTWVIWQYKVHKPATDYGCPPPPKAAYGIDLNEFNGDEKLFKAVFGVAPKEIDGGGVVNPPVGDKVVIATTCNPRTAPVIETSTDAGTLYSGYAFEKAGEKEGEWWPIKVWVHQSVVK